MFDNPSPFDHLSADHLVICQNALPIRQNHIHCIKPDRETFDLIVNRTQKQKDQKQL
jgi:hypothetical protein